MSYGRIARWEPLREIAFGAIGAAFTPVGTATVDCTRLIGIKNTTDKDVYISFDGVDSHIRSIAGSGDVRDVSTNKVQNEPLMIPRGTVISVKRAAGAPTIGLVSIELMFADGGV